jgi:putative endonuclease
LRRRTFFVYIMASKSRTLYTGITSKLYSRVYEHKNELLGGFTSKYKIHRLVYYESFDDVRKAISREKQIKAWTRTKRIALISRANPTWEDLAEDWYKSHPYQPEKAGPSPAARDDNSKQVSRAAAAGASKVLQKQIPRSARDDNSNRDLNSSEPSQNTNA